jgi:HNH endonuclease
MFDGYRRARTEAHYNAPYFLQMLQERLGYDTAIHLIHLQQPSIGFTHLWERERLDLTVEALVLRPEWQHIFSEADLRAARHRLEQYHYDFPPDSWDPDRSQIPPPTPPATDLADAPPERIQTTTYRVLRDTELARRVKVIHEFKCQLCGHTIELPDGSRYAEAHHIQPLGEPHNGPDVIGNILCLCPNHHAELDYRVSAITIARLRRSDAHPIDPRYVDYHNRLIQEPGNAQP